MLSKFLNTKTLIILLLILGGIYLVTKLTEKEDRTFKSELVAIDTSLVSKIVVIPKIGSGPKVTLTQTGAEWSVESEGKTYKSDLATVHNILSELNRMRTIRVAAIDESKWDEQQVTDSTATRIQLWNNDEILADLYLGKFSYQQAQDPQNPYGQQQTRMFTHIRPVDDDIVYVVEGFIKMTIQSKVDHYRAKTLAAIERLDITKVTFDYPGNEDFTITRENNTWLVNGMPCDTNETNRYLMKFKRLTASAFLSDTDEISATPSHTVKFEGNNIFPVEIKAYPAADTNLRYGIRTSLVPDAIYNGGKNKLFEKIYIDPAGLMPK
jgi:hypothetical protein